MGVKPKGGWYVFSLFFKICLSSSISFRRSRRELSIDVAEHKSMLKNDPNTRNPCFNFILKTDEAFPKTGVLFLQCTLGHKSHDPCFHIFLMEAGVMTFVDHCTLGKANLSQTRYVKISLLQVRLGVYWDRWFKQFLVVSNNSNKRKLFAFYYGRLNGAMP